MKELSSTEEKDKAYDGNYKAYIVLINRLENVKDAIKKQNYGIAMDILCKPYHEFQITTSTELAESEDERIRKVLIDGFKRYDDGSLFNGCLVRDIVAWLEKQGTQILANSTKTCKDEQNTVVVIPKFRVGDVICPKGSTTEYTIESISGGCYCGNLWRLPISCDDDYELVEQKPAWSEEDEENLNWFDKFFRAESVIAGGRDIPQDRYLWFKNLKDRVQPKQEWKQENTDDLTDFENAMMHIGGSFFGKNAGLDPNDTNAIKEQANLLLELVPKQGWSEEDENVTQVLRDIVRHSNEINETIYTIPLKEKLYNWLKSLKDRYIWKPSNEQINALAENIEYVSVGCTQPILKGLLEDLKKLME